MHFPQSRYAEHLLDRLMSHYLVSEALQLQPAVWKIAAFPIGKSQSRSVVLRTTAKAILLRTAQPHSTL